MKPQITQINSDDKSVKMKIFLKYPVFILAGCGFIFAFFAPFRALSRANFLKPNTG